MPQDSVTVVGELRLGECLWLGEYSVLSFSRDDEDVLSEWFFLLCGFSLGLCPFFFQSMSLCESFVRLVEEDAVRSFLQSVSVVRESRLVELAELL
jgi:hypothetical protein